MNKDTMSAVELFPPLEYLTIVGYFDRYISNSGKLICDTFAAISDALPGMLDTTNVDTVLRSNGNRVSELDCRYGDWKYNRERLQYTYEGRHSIAQLFSENGVICKAATTLAGAMLVKQGRGYSRFKAFNYDWLVSFSQCEQDPVASRDGLCVVGLPTRLFREDDKGLIARKSADVANAVIRTWIKYSHLYYALADANYFRENGAGWCYESDGPSNWSTVRFRIEQDLWEQAGAVRRQCVRGVYPCQYLSTSHLAKLGGKTAFVAQLLGQLDRPDDLITELENESLILRLAPTPIDSSAFGLNQGFDAATWVFRRFREAGLFL